MAKQRALFLHAGHNAKYTTFTNADTNTAKQVFVAGANDTDVKVGNICSDDSATVNLRIYIRRSGVNYIQGTARVLALSGTDGVVLPVNMLSANILPSIAIDPVFKPYLPLQAGDEIWASCVATMTAGKTCTVTIIGHDY